MFLPMPGSNGGKRINQQASFETAWRGLFDASDLVSPDVAVVTFHLTTNPPSISRRLFVIARKAGQWKITHLHAIQYAAGGCTLTQATHRTYFFSRLTRRLE